jgi:exosortase/archaeosortase family protein
VFIATSTAVAMLIRRSPLQRSLIVLSAVPIALLCNIIRITATGMAHETVGHEAANLIYHDLAGWLMAPLALVFLGAELLILRRLFVPVGGAEVDPA